MDRIVRRTLFGFFLFALFLSFVQVIRNRGFWLDEAMVFDSLRLKSALGILFGGVLNYGQQFPRFYLCLIDLLVRLGSPATLWARFLPLLFGLGGFAVWLFFFFEHYWLRQQRAIPCIVAGGLLVANSYSLYYCYELKSYSADFFFAGLLLTLFQTKLLSSHQRIRSVLCAFLMAPLFSYPSLFVMTAIVLTCMVNHEERRIWWDHRRQIVPFFAVEVILLIILYRLDYRFGEPPDPSAVLHSYWQQHFVRGHTFVEKAVSLKNLYGVFVTDWWKTEYGPIHEQMVGSHWYLWPYRTFKNPDIRNVIRGCSFFLILLTLGGSLCRTQPRKELLLPSLLVVMMAFLATFQIYPWGISRLVLYAMPISVLLVVESLKFLEDRLRSVKYIETFRGILWVPFFWAVLRNGVFFAMALACAPLPQNLADASRHMSAAISPFLVVSGANDVIVRASSSLPKGVEVIYEKELSGPDLRLKLGHHPFYFLWAHYPPDLNKDGVPKPYVDDYKAEEVFVRPPELGLGLLLLKPKSS